MNRFVHILILIFALTASLKCQVSDNTVLSFKSSELEISKKAREVPELIVKELTKDKTSDKEKFDILFAWVATNIRYDYRAYFSSGGTYSEIPTILKYRTAICVGYAHLMDTLCKWANIPNTTIFGYARDIYSDVGDSLYLDNHAWNAVKLDGQWYVYDVTWSTGKEEYVLNWFNKWKRKTLSKLHPEFKKKRLRKKWRLSFIDECGKEFKSPAFIFKQRFLNKLKLALLGRMRVKVKRAYTTGINSDFYLCNPDLFAVTHFPDDPVWTLTQAKEFKHFENDSAYYYLNDTLYKTQAREGRDCPQCDDFLGEDVYKQNLITKARSGSLNIKNQMMQAICNFNLGEMNFTNGKNESDSLTRLKYLDSALYYMLETRQNMKKAKFNIVKEYVQLKAKNKAKVKSLVKENKLHIIFAKSKVKTTREQNRAFNSMMSKSRAYSQTYRKRAKQIRQMKTTPIKGTSKVSAKVVEQLKSRMNKNLGIIDSLNDIVKESKTQFEFYIVNLSLNIWQQAKNHDTINRPFSDRIWQRLMLLDNYKKPVNDLTRYIYAHEVNYSNGINAIVYIPVSECIKHFNIIVKLLNYKYSVEKEVVNQKMMLARWNEESPADFKNYKDEILQNRKADYCWLENYYPHVHSVSMGLYELFHKQVQMENIINYENSVERQREALVNKEYLRRNKKHRNITSHNARLANLKAKEIKKFKRSLLRKKKVK